MPSIEIVTAAGIVILAILVWLYIKLRGKDRVEEVLARHRGSARLCSRACLLEGMEQIPVALVLNEWRAQRARQTSSE